MDTKASTTAFFWRITYSHVIAYFLAGIFALIFMKYRELYSEGVLSQLMRPVDAPITALGPGLQIIRGLIIALVLFPIRKIILDGNKGILKLGWLILGLSAISTIGPSPGSFEGLIYTKLPLASHLLGIPETLIYIILFCGILWLSYRFQRKIVLVLSIVLVAIIVFCSVAGFLAFSGGV